MKNLLGIFTLIFMIGGILAGCGNAKLSDAFDEQNVTDTAKQIVSYMNDEDYDSITALATESLQANLSGDVLKSAVEQVCPNAGAFKDYKNVSVTGKTTDDGELAVVIVIAEYENQNVTYTISFNTKMELSGFYIK